MMLLNDERGKDKVTIPTTIQYVFAFLLLTFLGYQAHEVFHHLVGGVLCGGFGTMTFTAYEPIPQCALDDVVTLAGPFLSFAIAWFGAYLLRQRKHMLFGYTLIFASYAHLRFPLPLMRSGDEWLVARTNFDQPNPYLVAGILFLLALPPLVCAYKSIANRQRFLIFITSWLMPFLILFGLPILDERLPGASMDLSLLGIPVIVVAVDLAAMLLLVLGANWIFRKSELIYR